jgi:hypothetical protein
MTHPCNFLRAALLIILIGLVSPVPVEAQATENSIPEGFYLISSAAGVSLYRKDYPGGSPDFVQVVELDAGAKIIALHGDIHERRPGKGAYGGDDAQIMSQSLQKFWSQLSNEYGDAFCTLNGQFFYMKESPTRLPFPLKVANEIVSDGYGLNEFPDKKLILEIWPDAVNIRELTSDSLYSSTAPDIIGGLMQTANKRSDHYVGRTFVGTDDRDLDGTFETFLIFNSKISRQVDAAGVLQAFGADQVMMLDGGGSTQLICQGETLIKSDRPIPQAIGVISASQANQPASQPDPAAGEPSSQAELSTHNSPIILPDPTPQEKQQVEQSTETVSQTMFNLSDVLWVPVIMSPVLAVLVFFVSRLWITEQ